MLPAVLASELAVVAAGLSLSFGSIVRVAGGERLLLLLMRLPVLLLLLVLVLLVELAATVAIDKVELFREAAADPVAFFLDLALPPDPLGPEPLFLFLMTSVLRLRGRTTPCSLRKRPQALHSG